LNECEDELWERPENERAAGRREAPPRGVLLYMLLFVFDPKKYHFLSDLVQT
jgi:hypothetical protein